MTLEEAIRHAEEVAQKCEAFVRRHSCDRELGFVKRCQKCAEEQRQLAEWLKELKKSKGEWLRMSDLSEKDDNRYKCSRCGNVIHHKSRMDLYIFNSWCGRCGSDNSRRTTITEVDKWEEDAPTVIEAEGEG